MTVSGTVGEVAKFAALELQVNVEVTRTAGLAAFTGLKLGALPAFTASARLTDGDRGLCDHGTEARQRGRDDHR